MNRTTKSKMCVQFLLSKNVDPVDLDYGVEIFLVILNVIIVVPTIAFNLLMIITILKTPSLRKPSYILMCTLAFTDLGVGVIVQPLYIVRKISALRSDFSLYCRLLEVGDILAHLICSPSFFIVTATSVDRYLAITTGLRYRQIVTTFRIILTGLASLVFSGLITVTRVLANKEKYMSFAAVIMFFCFIVIVYSYVKSLTALNTLQNTVQCQSQSLPDGTTRPKCVFDIAQYKSALATLAIVTAVLFVCYVPFVSVVIGIAVNGRSKTMNMAREVTFTLLYLNSCLTPIVYGWRSKELKQACVQLLKNIRTTRNTANSAPDSLEVTGLKL